MAFLKKFKKNVTKLNLDRQGFGLLHLDVLQSRLGIHSLADFCLDRKLYISAIDYIALGKSRNSHFFPPPIFLSRLLPPSLN